jgi:hypothetical protein
MEGCARTALAWKLDTASSPIKCSAALHWFYKSICVWAACDAVLLVALPALFCLQRFMHACAPCTCMGC